MAMIYELRVYQRIPGQMPKLLDRFRDHVVPIGEGHGIALSSSRSAHDIHLGPDRHREVGRHACRRAARAEGFVHRSSDEHAGWLRRHHYA